VSASETTCQPNGVGCVVPPVGAQFYPYYGVVNGGGGEQQGCTLVFGNISGPGVRTFGRDGQYGTPDLAWFFGQNSSGPMANPCLPQSENSQN
jgi:hypothetical protein